MVQIRTSKILLDQEKDIINFYNTKINELREQFEEENEKQAKRDQDFLEKENKLMGELEWIKGIAQKIDVENHYLVKRYTELKVEYQTQENDRQMLLKETVLQKNRKDLLAKKIDYYKTMVQKSMMDNEQAPDSPKGDIGKYPQVDAYNEDSNYEDDNREDSENRGYSAGVDMMNINRTTSGQYTNGNVSQGKSSGHHKRKDSASNRMRSDDRGRIGESMEAEDIIKEIKEQIEGEREKILLMKTKYVQKLDEKNELEKLMRKCINDYKEDLWAIKSKMKFVNTEEQDEQFEAQIKETIREILAIEKQLSLLYDKVFYTKGHESYKANGNIKMV